MCDCNCKDLKVDQIRLEEKLAYMESAMRPFISGHPLQFIQEATDVAAFDTTTGLGSGRWAQWAIANGNTYTGTNGSVITYDMRDRFAVGSGTTYAVGATGGSATHTLTAAELPVITPTLTDPGHNHAHTDAGHAHTTTEVAHTHVVTQAPHNHTGTTSTDGSHTHVPKSAPGNGIVTSNNNGTFLDAATGIQVDDSDSLAANGDHSHTLNIVAETPLISAASAVTGLSVNSNTTGVTNTANTTGITVSSFGSGDAHNNLPPYMAGLWVQLIG